MNKLPTELTTLVNETLSLLGEVAKIEFGKPIFSEVEKIRKSYKNQRKSSDQNKVLIHRQIAKKLKQKTVHETLSIAHTFAVSLELINACENAYRSYRLSNKRKRNEKKKITPIIFVLTAHPTEARSSESIELLDKITELLFVKLKNKELNHYENCSLRHLIHLLIKIPLSKTKAPTVSDEAETIYSIILKKQNIEKLCEFYENGQPVYIRTWVGGDKDGHPGVNEKAMLLSLHGSRRRIVLYFKNQMKLLESEIELISNQIEKTTDFIEKIKKTLNTLSQVGTIKKQDGSLLKKIHQQMNELETLYKNKIGTESPLIKRLRSLLNIFPGLVIPLELREDSATIENALATPSLPIIKMISTLKKICGSSPAHWYVRGLIISMCESEDDIKNAVKLLNRHLGGLKIPIVPLFETKLALESSVNLTKRILEIPEFKKALNSTWGKKYEVMVGYSDSAKESGALFSRVTIKKSLHQLDKLLKKNKYTPIFFHGSGGSVARGGGSIKEQMSWWPKSAQQRFKTTIQGEMIYRTFASGQIFESQVEKIVEISINPLNEKTEQKTQKTINHFSENVRRHYYEKVNQADFMKIVSMATPYRYLDQLKIGSRPSKRKNSLNLKNLRAIPWILCWTQTRVLFPVWWGIGTSWKSLSETEKKQLRKACKKDSFFRSFIQLLAYTVSKVDLSVWEFYLENSEISKEQQSTHIETLKKELIEVKKMIQSVSGEKEILWFRPWLKESIMLRSTLIYPLNILEVHALKTRNIPLLRETVTGVASGMLTTG